MRKIRLVADSSSDVLTLERAEYNSAPLKIIASTREFVDDEELDVDEMVDFIGAYKGKSRTSCPNTADWLKAFGDADDVICVTITSGLSGSYNSACTAKQIYEAEHEGRRVFVLDSLSTGPEITLVLEKLETLISEGKDFDTIVGEIKKYHEGTGLLFILRSLRTLANNGRVSPIVAKIVDIAGICIVGKASDVGTLETMHKCRGEARAIATLVSELEKNGLCRGRVSIGHCKNESAAEAVKNKILEKFSEVKVEIHKLRGLCSFYAERGGLLVGYEKN